MAHAAYITIEGVHGTVMVFIMKCIVGNVESNYW